MAKDGYGNIVNDKSVDDIVTGVPKLEEKLTQAVQDEFTAALEALRGNRDGRKQMAEISGIIRKYAHPNSEKGGFRTGQAGNALEEIRAYRRTHNIFDFL